jgi:hypothetical protein
VSGKGAALIIANNEFEKNNHLPGVKRDFVHMQALLPQLGFPATATHSYQNISADQMDAAVAKFVDGPCKEKSTEAVLIYISSHGGSHYTLFGRDDETVKLRALLNRVQDCRELRVRFCIIVR